MAVADRQAQGSGYVQARSRRGVQKGDEAVRRRTEGREGEGRQCLGAMTAIGQDSTNYDERGLRIECPREYVSTYLRHWTAYSPGPGIGCPGSSSSGTTLILQRSHSSSPGSHSRRRIRQHYRMVRKPDRHTSTEVIPISGTVYNGSEIVVLHARAHSASHTHINECSHLPFAATSYHR